MSLRPRALHPLGRGPRLSDAALALCALSGCSSTSSTPSPPPSACANDVITVASDYRSSAVGGFTLDGTGAMTGGVDLGTDPVLATSNDGHTFLISREDAAVLALDACGFPVSSFKVLAPSATRAPNPHDLAVASDGRTFVTLFNVPSVAILDAAHAPLTSIDTSLLDPDGNPNADAIRIMPVGPNGAEKAFVTLERLDDNDMLKSEQPSWMLQIDVASSTVDQTIPLIGRNPFSVFSRGTTIYLAEPENFDAIDEPLAGIEVFDAKTATSQMLVSEHDLGASVAEVAVDAAGDCGAAIVADAAPNVNRTSLVTFDPQKGVVLSPASAPVLGPTGNFDLEGLLWVSTSSGEALLLGDRRSGANGRYPVHVFDRTGTCELRERPDVIFLTQKPIAFRANR